MDNVDNKIKQYCGFKIQGEEFAIPVMEVQEIIKQLPVTLVPLAPKEIRGLINLRGQIVTSISLREIFGNEDDLKKDIMNIIVRSTEGLFSLVVDEVTDILEVEAGEIELTPSTLNPKLKNYVDGVYKKESGLVILLNVTKILALEEVKTEEKISEISA